MEGGRIIGIAWDIEFAAIHSNKRILVVEGVEGKLVVKAIQNVPEGIRDEFGPLLNKSGGRRGFVRIKEEIFEQLMVNTTDKCVHPSQVYTSNSRAAFADNQQKWLHILSSMSTSFFKFKFELDYVMVAKPPSKLNDIAYERYFRLEKVMKYR